MEESDPEIKSSELLLHTTRANLKIIMLSEKSKTKKSTYCMIPFIQNSRKCKVIYSDRSGSVAALGVGAGERLPGGTGNLLGGMECPGS